MCIWTMPARSENGFEMWIADDVSIPNVMIEKFLAPTPPARAKNVYLGNGSSEWKTDFKYV